MWIRRTSDKFSLLTVGNNTYSGDPRIKVKFQYPNNWRLHINSMQKEDAGLYMCQVSTHPPRVFATNVTVLRKYNLLLVYYKMRFRFSTSHLMLFKYHLSIKLIEKILLHSPPPPSHTHSHTLCIHTSN